MEVRNQKDSLDDFRTGHKNLIITTNALEEGIDISACNVVICFDKPPNLKSFIQRRGRARKSASKYVVMFQRGADDSAISKWQDLEQEMKQIYMDEMRQLEELKGLEANEEGYQPPLEVQSTGFVIFSCFWDKQLTFYSAKLTMAESVKHLYHFCDTLPSDPYAARKPIFLYQDASSAKDEKAISATVLLPNSVDASVRTAGSKSLWKTEAKAKQDACETHHSIGQA